MESLKSVYQKLAKATERKDWRTAVLLCEDGLDSVPGESAEERFGLSMCLAVALLEGVDDVPENADKAIQIYEELLSSVDRETEPLKWARLKRNLAFALEQRRSGQRKDNLAGAIKHYEEAAVGLAERGEDYDWACIKAALGFAYSELRSGDELKDITSAIANFEDACRVFSEEAYREDRAEIERALDRLKARLGRYV
jgi:hypothetical protein